MEKIRQRIEKAPLYTPCSGEKSWGDICLFDGAYRIGGKWFSASHSVLVHSRCGKALAYLLEHIGEKASEEELRRVMGSKNPLPTLITTLQPKLYHSKMYLLFVRQSTKKGRYAALVDLTNPDLMSRLGGY